MMRWAPVVACLAIMGSVSLIGCQPVTGNLAKLSVGMSKAEVIDVLGKPDSASADGSEEKLLYYMDYDSNVIIFNREALPLYEVKLKDGKLTGYEKVRDGVQRSLATPASGYSVSSPSQVSQIGISANAIESRIDGEFEGFEQGKIFKLQNGQIWEQESFQYYYSYKYAPRVICFRNGGTYQMKVDGVDTIVNVRRLK